MKFITLFVCMYILSGCSENYVATTASPPEFTLQCDLNVPYTPVTSPVLASAINGVPSATVIAIHGKNGSPLNSHMATLKNALSAEYDVIMPYMPWSSLTWNGTLCDSISYLNELIAQEQNNGKYVILVGHSLAGPVVLAYSALADTAKADAVNIVAPGHFIHQSSVLADAHAASITLAKSMVDAGQGEQLNVFQTVNLGQSVSISASATAYLSMHEPSQFPNILSSIPLTTTPTLWLAGQEDSLTATVKNLGIIGSIPTEGTDYTYKELPGDHFTVLNNVPAELRIFF